ncbi:hypothetical protein [Actinophytocola xinjiangensis]|uniref:hypothetical protein n=1 Tax=Actinophytocola xinjiangensis TaxID=485602 RepID=UPI000A4B7DDF|nr:hypothetical protein [Actinophytocola xinjiangensis]
MDPYSAQIIAASRAADFRREAEESQAASANRRTVEAARPAREPVRRPLTSRRARLVQ